MKNNNAYGFTIVELTIAIAMISILILAIVFTSIKLGDTYTKGVTIKQVNQAGRDLNDMMRRDIMASQPESIKFIAPGAYGQSEGRFCTGQYIYIWNTPAAIKDNKAATYQDTKQAIIFARAPIAGAVSGSKNPCDVIKEGNRESLMNIVLNANGSKELLSNNAQELVIHNLNAQNVLASERQAIWRIAYTIGTNEQGTLNGAQCKPPTDAEANNNYCSVNDFEIYIRAGGGKSSE